MIKSSLNKLLNSERVEGMYNTLVWNLLETEPPMADAEAAVSEEDGADDVEDL